MTSELVGSKMEEMQVCSVVYKFAELVEMLDKRMDKMLDKNWLMNHRYSTAMKRTIPMCKKIEN
jgi:hypothetical protein